MKVTFAKFEYEGSSSETQRVFEKTNDFLSFLKKGRLPSGLEVFMLTTTTRMIGDGDGYYVFSSSQRTSNRVGTRGQG